MISEIEKAIATKIYTALPKVHISVEDVSQGLERPQIIITLITPDINDWSMLNECTYTFMIQYFAEDKVNENAEFMSTYETLREALKIIDIILAGKTSHARRMIESMETANGIMNYKVGYIVHTYEHDDSEVNMETVSTGITEKG